MNINEQIDDEIKESMSKTAKKFIKDREREFMGVYEKAGRPSVPLTGEVFERLKRRLADHVLVIANDHIPDDCYGILMVRKEDADNIRKTTNIYRSYL